MRYQIENSTWLRGYDQTLTAIQTQEDVNEQARDAVNPWLSPDGEESLQIRASRVISELAGTAVLLNIVQFSKQTHKGFACC